MSEEVMEEWHAIRGGSKPNEIAAVSNRGNLRYGDGFIRPAKIYDRYGLGNQNRALYQKCYNHYKSTGTFLEV